jgi:predicted ATPase/DNA-binding winged helix-turn-helix (wHTH) protein
MATATHPAEDALSFGPFKLIASERLLTKGDIPVELGARAFDILIALISCPNEVVTKKYLMSRVWPDVTVEEGSLRFHMTSLRKALGDGKDGARYITTLAGRGYCFVAPVSQANRQRSETPPAPSAASFSYANLPQRLSRMIGRDDDVAKLSAQLSASRLVTIVGPGGVGKTTVAIAVAHQVADAFAGSVLFADLGMLNEPRLATTAISSMLGLSVQSDDATPGLIAFLRGKRILLVLDTCEHLVDAVAALAAGVLEAAPRVHILATSREALRTDGEHIYRLDALTIPPDDLKLTAETVRQFPAAQLFLDRAAASGARFEISDTDAPLVAEICRKLDGMPLAIELIARRVELHGIQQTAALLDQHLSLLWQGSRTAPPRQKTLQATLNWSYDLLSDVERMVLRRLSAFVGHFTLDAALEVASGAPLDRTNVTMAIDSLVEKSMVVVRPIGATARYRLLDTTRAYALETDTDAAGRAELLVRHASYFRHWLKQTGDEWESLSTGPQRAPFFANLNNVRAALEWSFGESGNVTIGVELAAAAAPVFLAMSLLAECQRWSERALQALDETRRGGEDEMQLQAGFGIATMFMRGNSDPVQAALNRSLAIAETRNDAVHMAGMLGMLQLYHLRGGDYRNALQFAERSAAIAQGLDDPRLSALAHSMLGIARHLAGDLDGARTELEAALRYESAGATAGRVFYFGFDQLTLANAALATTLWLQGYSAEASARAIKAAADAEHTNHPLSLSNALTAITVLLWIGEIDAAEQHLNWFIARAETQYFRPYIDVGRGLKAELAIRRGDVEAGVETLRDCLKNLQAARFGRFTGRFNIFLARGLAESGRPEEAIALIDETIELIGAKGGIPYTPELLRLKGSIILAMPKPRAKDAEVCFTKSLELSRDSGSRFWELRTATDLAALWASQKRAKDARALLLPVFEQFTEGLDTPDLKAAERVLKTLR